MNDLNGAAISKHIMIVLIGHMLEMGYSQNEITTFTRDQAELLARVLRSPDVMATVRANVDAARKIMERV